MSDLECASGPERGRVADPETWASDVEGVGELTDQFFERLWFTARQIVDRPGFGAFESEPDAEHGIVDVREVDEVVAGADDGKEPPLKAANHPRKNIGVTGTEDSREDG